MDASETPSQFEPIVRLFRKHGVEFIVIGGRAETLLGSARITFDTDLCYRRTIENLERLASALKEIQPTLRGAPKELKFHLDAGALALGNNYTFETSLGALDLIGFVEPIGDYEAVAKHAETHEFAGAPLQVIALDDLIRIKQLINRPKDRDSLMHLLAIKRIRGEKCSEQ